MNDSSGHHRTFQAVRAALEGPEREAVLAHLAGCEECAHALAGLCAQVAPAPGLRVRPMEPVRSERVRARLLARAREERHRGGRGALAAAGGWLVAAGIATLLLTHHAFHRPLSMGWVAAALLGIALFGAGVYIVVQRRRLAALRRELEHHRAPSPPGEG